MAVTNSGKSSVSVGSRFLLKVTKKTFQQKLHFSLTLRCRINRGVGQNKRRGWRSLLNLINRGRRFDISKYSLISVMNEKRDTCLMLMLNLKVSKQTRSEASKNKVIIKRVSNISIN